MTAKGGVWVWDKELQKLVPKSEYLARKYGDRKRGDVPMPAIRPDAIYMWNPLTGKPATSKSQYYRDVKNAGCYINEDVPRGEEVMNKAAAWTPSRAGKDIAQAYEQLEAGHKPPPEEGDEIFQ